MKRIKWTKTLVRKFIKGYNTLSAQDLAARYGWSVITVNKIARKLRESGFDIAKQGNKGYTLEEVIEQMKQDKQKFTKMAKPEVEEYAHSNSR